MAGHSKWANIQHRKNRQDARRGRLFSRLIREITVAARLGGANTMVNPRLRAAIEAANAHNLPKSNVERAVSRAGSGNEEGHSLEEVSYEGYAPGGVAVLVHCVTDNRKRTVADVRYAFKCHGGNLGNGGSVAHLFQRAGFLRYPPQIGEEVLFEPAAEAGAEELQTQADGTVEIITAAEHLMQVRDALETAGYPPREYGWTLLPSNEVELTPPEAEPVLALLNTLEELEDVQKVYCNASFPETVSEQDPS